MKPLAFFALLVVIVLFSSLPFRTRDVAADGTSIEGSGTINRIARFTDVDCIGNSVIREDTAGNVGIGATNPAVKLLVNGGRFAVNANTGGSLGALIANQDGSGPIAMFSTDTGTDVRMLVDSNGNVGVGTASPGATLHVQASSSDGIRLQNDNEVQLQIRAYGSASYPLLDLTHGRGSGAAPMAVMQNDLLGGINGNGYSESNAWSTGAGLYFEASEDWDSANKGARIVFRGRQNGWGGGTFEWMRLVNGDVGIGSSNPTEKLHVVGNICATGTIGVCSDMRFKKDVEPLDGPLDSVRKLQGVSYTWNEQFRETTGDMTQDRQIGLIAQDVEKILPEVVSTGRTGYRSVDYGKITAVLIEAVKAQQLQIEDLQAQLEALRD